jgi:hypothetical protein
VFLVAVKREIEIYENKIGDFIGWRRFRNLFDAVKSALEYVTYYDSFHPPK